MISIVIPSLPDSEELNEKVEASYRETAESDVQVCLEVGERTFAENVNAGLKRATGEIILVSNNDVIALPGWSHWIEKAVYRHPLGLIAALSPSPQMGWGFAFSRETLEKVGLLDEDLVNSYDDYDWFIRAAQQGIGRILAPKNFAIHQGGVSLSRVWGEFRSQSRERMAQCKANREVMLRKWPGLNIDAVPTLFWVYRGVEVMREWNREHIEAS